MPSREGRLMADSATAVDTPVNVPKPESKNADTTTRAVFIGLGVLLLVAPFLFYPVFLMKVLCFALFACAFNLLLGFGGLLSFGHAAYFGMAGYVTAHCAQVWGLAPALPLRVGRVAAAPLGTVIGALAIRRQGIYFAMTTLALAQMVYFFCSRPP